MSNHKNLTFRILDNGGKGNLVGIGVSNSDWFFAEECTKANAEFIVKACNNHYQLLGALKYMVDNIGQPRSLETREGFSNAEQVIKDVTS